MWLKYQIGYHQTHLLCFQPQTIVRKTSQTYVTDNLTISINLQCTYNYACNVPLSQPPSWTRKRGKRHCSNNDATFLDFLKRNVSNFKRTIEIITPITCSLDLFHFWKIQRLRSCQIKYVEAARTSIGITFLRLGYRN